MADVDRQRDFSERAQMLLIGAVMVGVALLVVATMLNGVIYNENVSTRSKIGSQSATQYVHMTDETVGELIQSVNYNDNTSYSDLEAQIDEGIATWEENTTEFMIGRGHRVEVTSTAYDRGTRIVQWKDADFRDASGTPLDTWVLAPSVSGMRVGGMNVTRSSLQDGSSYSTGSDYMTNTNNVFAVAFIGSPSHHVFVYKESGSPNRIFAAVVEADGSPSVLGECSGEVDSDGYGVVDLVNNSVAGSACSALDFSPNNRDLKYFNGDSVEGKYEYVIGKDRGSLTLTHYNVGGGNPDATWALYDVTIDVKVVGHENTFEDTIVIEPEGTYFGSVLDAGTSVQGTPTDTPTPTDSPVPSGNPPSPSIDSVSDKSKCTDTGQSSGCKKKDEAKFQIDWSASDSDDDLQSVTVELVDSSGTVVDSERTTVGGSGSASGKTTLSETGGYGETYTIRVKATDSSNTRKSEQTEIADGS